MTLHYFSLCRGLYLTLLKCQNHNPTIPVVKRVLCQKKRQLYIITDLALEIKILPILIIRAMVHFFFNVLQRFKVTGFRSKENLMFQAQDSRGNSNRTFPSRYMVENKGTNDYIFIFSLIMYPLKFQD